MCGIAGAFSFSADAKPIERAVIEQLNELQRRRGPDGTGLWSSGDRRVVFGHRRLAIIDTSTQGAQPMSDATGRWTITFNGEIYNYRELRRELECLGCRFLTNSDTEVLINAIDRWGEAGLTKLRGMYAFALWDAMQEELWLVRDPYGIKPLYVSEIGNTIWFASQARALASCAPIDRRRDAAALTGFYIWGHVPEPFSWWAGIRMFPAGHLQRIRFGRAPSPSKPFCLIQECFVGQPALPLAAGELRQLMLDSVRHHLVADVPVGVFLSAGVDSTVVAALSAELGTKLRTVTLAFDEYAGTSDDEAPIAEQTARALRFDHATVRITREDFHGLLDDFIRCMDQPTIDGLNTYLVSRAAAAQGLKVVLSGLGGDELFGGYPSFFQIPKFLKWGRRLSAFGKLGQNVQWALRILMPSAIPPKAAGLFTHSKDVASAYLLRRALHLENELDALLDESWWREGVQRLSTVAALWESIAPLSSSRATSHSQVAALESCWYLRNQLLRDTDWSSMAHGLEVRVPYVDAALVQRLGPAIASDDPPRKSDLVACIPPRLYSAAGRPKTGFTTPVQNWLAEEMGSTAWGLRGWAAQVHREFRAGLRSNSEPRPPAMAA